jgi:hypothetical protein
VPCSGGALAAAITTANGLGRAVLSLPAGCTFNVATPATAADGLPIITGSVTLAGGQNTAIKRVGSAAYRLLEVAAGGTLIVNHVTVSRGSTAGPGGAILDGGTLIVNQAALAQNTAGNGGAISITAGATARITDTLFSANTTTGVGGGAIINFATLTLDGSASLTPGWAPAAAPG